MPTDPQALTRAPPRRTPALPRALILRRVPTVSRTPALHRTSSLALGVALLGALGGCGLAGSPFGAHRGNHARPGESPAAQAAVAQSADPEARMVAAVSPSSATGAGPISVKFRLETRPVVGTPVKIMVAVMSAADVQIDRLHGAFLPSDGLALQSERSFDAADVRGGTTLYREVTVLPMQSGVLNLNATILVDLDKSSEARTYSIPLIATATDTSS